MSIAANIAEGAVRHGIRDFLRFVGIAGRSLAEAETFVGLVATARNEPKPRKPAQPQPPNHPPPTGMPTHRSIRLKDTESGPSS